MFSLSILFLLDALHTAFQAIESNSTLVAEQTLAQKMGPLDKLCFYSNLLVQESEGKHLAMLAEEIRALALQQKSVQDKLRTFFSALSPFFYGLRTNENILMYLIEHKKALNNFLGDRTVEALLRSLFPLGIEELRLILSDGYARRGFEDFFAKQEQLLETLEWEAPCDPLAQTL